MARRAPAAFREQPFPGDLLRLNPCRSALFGGSDRLESVLLFLFCFPLSLGAPQVVTLKEYDDDCRVS